MVMEAGIPEPLFAVPRVTAATDEDGALVIRSAEPLAGYPVTVMHSVRAWAAAEAAKLLGQEPRVEGELVTDETIRAELARALAGHNAAAGSAARIERLLVLARPAGLDAGEITDKGYVNQRQVLANRAALVELLYAEPEPESPENPGFPQLLRGIEPILLGRPVGAAPALPQLIGALTHPLLKRLLWLAHRG